jgi:hypothetical protein
MHSLKKLHREDPLKYDFALCHLGIAGACPRRRDPLKCALPDSGYLPAVKTAPGGPHHGKNPQFLIAYLTARSDNHAVE